MRLQDSFTAVTPEGILNVFIRKLPFLTIISFFQPIFSPIINHCFLFFKLASRIDILFVMRYR